MKSVSIVAAAAVIAFLAGGCASQEPAAEKADKPMAKEKMADAKMADAKMAEKPALKFMTAAELSKAFGTGSIVCTWTAGKKGDDKGTDYYYKDISAMSGNADRVINDVTFPGTWNITGDTLSLKFGVVGNAQNYKLVQVDKKTYTAYLDGKKKKMTFKC